MSKTRFWVLLVSTALAAPAAGWAQTGACVAEVSIDPDESICSDDLTEGECGILGLDTLGFEWIEGATCDEQEFSWDGACFAPDFPDLGSLCILVDAADGDAAEALCTEPELEFPTRWLGDGSTCEGVPTLPVAGRGLLVLLLISGALVILKLR